jgi:geranylgeranyl diphosphate synthase type II
MLRKPDELRALVEGYLEELALTPELGSLGASMRYALAGGGERIRPVLCLATGDAAGAAVESLLPAAAAVELVHTFSLVHDDLPALDDDAERRGRASTWAEHGEATAILAGDALLAEALRLALVYPAPAVARELVAATLGMIGGQQLDLEGASDLAHVNRLKTGALFEASVMCGLHAADVPTGEHPPWRAFAVELGALFQLVDDLLDGDGSVLDVGADATRGLADEAGERAQARLASIPAETDVLAGIVSELAARTS